MSKIEWNDSFSVNNIEIDNQHKEWIEIFNNLHEGLTTTDNTVDKDTTADVLEAMHEYSQKHFSFEEEYMHKNNFPDFIGHHRIHKDFDSLIYSYNRDIREGKVVLNSQILKIIKNWLLDHILIEDKKYAAHIGKS
jgi:hemerythrin